ncbi:MAG: glycosyltransferase family 2 protein [Saprospiraceae bacterium]|nr:glycosyltransferase family 2 protein [Saprospiraceae bacterium]
MKTFPKVSCMCVTYGRTEVLDECVYSFLQQDYPGEKEMIILNDYGSLELKGDFPNVRIINEKTRYASLGEKRNACIEQCTGELISIWDDDDVFLPNRLTSAVKRIGIKPYILLNKHVYYSDEIRMIPYGVKAQALFYKSLWLEIGGYPAITNGEDIKFENEIRAKGKFSLAEIPDEEVAYIYRWRLTNSYHTSSFKDEDSHLGTKEHVMRTMDVENYEIKPHWKEDYIELVKNLIQSQQ